MKSIFATLWAEMLKIRKSGVFWLSFVFFAFITLMMGLLMFIQMHPEITDKLGIIGTKASLLRFGVPGWNSYFALLNQGIAAIGLIGYGFVTSWVFGREYSDRTVKDILALPISRSYIVFSKFIVIFIWCVLLTLVFFIFAIISGKIAGLPGWSEQVVFTFTRTYTAVSLLTILLCTPVAFFACVSRGYLLPFAFIILTMMLANFTGIVGLGPYFPWSIPGLLTVPSNEDFHLSSTSYLILFITSTLGYAGTLAWWRFSDQK
jgi:ABC-type transport system involved in multi-copper enzyme maturation permease subunit